MIDLCFRKRFIIILIIPTTILSNISLRAYDTMIAVFEPDELSVIIVATW